MSIFGVGTAILGFFQKFSNIRIHPKYDSHTFLGKWSKSLKWSEMTKNEQKCYF
jgi:hypothetical protein